jgi:hypothetical protein
MKYASVIFHQQRRDEMFAPSPGANGGGLYFPFKRLRERFAEVGVQLATPDMNAGKAVAFELHINARRSLPKVPCYAYLWEHPLVRPINGDLRRLARYRGTFTWNESIVDDRHVHLLPIPNDLTVRPVPGFAERDLFCVLIAGNRALRKRNPLGLTDKRLAAIRWFDQHAPEHFALYGHGWDRPAQAQGITGRLTKRLHAWRARWWPTPGLRTYRGAVASKDEVLLRAKFSICYENVRGGAGYVTEKIFDAMLFGCLPIYIGASDIAQRVPPECYIDGDRYDDPADLYAALRSIGEDEFRHRRERTLEFLRSEQAQELQRAHFCSTLVRTIAADLGLQP